MSTETGRKRGLWLSVIVTLLCLSLGGLPAQALIDDPEEPESEEREPESEDSEKVRFVLPHVEGSPGEDLLVPLQIQSPIPLAMLSWSVQYDGRFFEFLDVELSDEVVARMASHAREESLFETFTGEPSEDEEEDEPGDADDDEVPEREESGWFQAVVVTDFDAREEFALEAGVAVTVAYLRFRIYDDTPFGAYSLEFSMEEEARFESRLEAEDGKLVYNVFAGSDGTSLAGALYDASTRAGLENGSIIVRSLPGDIGIFRRGDANLDLQIDMTDPVRALRFLFLDPTASVCSTTADANANGTLELTDAVVVLGYLFLQSRWVPESVQISRLRSLAEVTDRSAPGCEW